jgi:hypothetical protein
MSDRGLPVNFGFFPEPVAADAALVVEDVLLAERLGYDLVGIQDHPYNPQYLDTMTLLAVLAARTTRIGLFPDVASLPLRPPAVLAKWVDPEVPRGSGRGCVLEPGEVDGAGDVEGFLWGACREAGAQDGVFVAFAGGGVDREAEGVG